MGLFSKNTFTESVCYSYYIINETYNAIVLNKVLPFRKDKVLQALKDSSPLYNRVDNTPHELKIAETIILNYYNK